MGISHKEILPEERNLSHRTSIFAKIDSPKNLVILEELLIIKRPVLEIKLQFYNSIIGIRANKDIKKDDPIK